MKLKNETKKNLEVEIKSEKEKCSFQCLSEWAGVLEGENWFS